MNLTKRKKKGILSILLIAVSLMLLLAANVMEGFADWYSQHIYRVLVRLVGGICGLLPFSLSEVLIYILVAGIMVFIMKSLFLRWKKKRKVRWEDVLVNAGLFLSVLFFLYTINCGLNYQRTSFSEGSGIKVQAYTVDDLKALCIKMTDYVNETSKYVKRKADGTADTDTDISQEAVNAMNRLGETYPGLRGYYPKAKGLLIPEILSYQSLSGVYSPFTVEANYNSAMIPYNIPFTQCHELSHLRGFMQEEEANFIAYLACKGSEDPFFRYSGSILGWLYSMNVLYEQDYDTYIEVRERLTPIAEMDLDANQLFWNEYEGEIAEVADKVNDTYLKANGQSDGVKSYDKMVDLLVVYEMFICKD